MRILSQEGREAFYDFPYDKCLVYTYGDKKTIKLQPLGEVESDYTMAIYSTEEKAKKVLDDLIINHRLQRTIFQFPKDEEGNYKLSLKFSF